MSVQTRNCYLTVHDSAGFPLENARVKIRLVGVGNEPGGAVAPESRTAYTDEDGYVEFQLWENRQDYSDTHYELTSTHPVKGSTIHARVPFRVFDSDADIVDLIAVGLAAAPIDATQALLDLVAADRAACEDAVVECQDAVDSSAGHSLAAASAATAAQVSAVSSAASAGAASTSAALALASSGVTPLLFYSGTPAIDLNSFTTAGAHFVVPFPAVSGVLNHPWAIGRPNFIDPTSEDFASLGDCQGVEIEVFQTIIPGFPTSPVIWQRATLINVGTTLVRQRKAGESTFGAWQTQSNSTFGAEFKSIFVGPGTQVSTGGSIEFFKEGAAIWVAGSINLLALNGSEVLTLGLGQDIIAPNTFAAFNLLRENGANAGSPRIVFSYLGTVTVISDSVTAPGVYFFSGRYLRASE